MGRDIMYLGLIWYRVDLSNVKTVQLARHMAFMLKRNPELQDSFDHGRGWRMVDESYVTLSLASATFL